MRKRISLKILLIGICVLLVGIALVTSISVNAQIQSANDIAIRLSQKGVPVRAVTTISLVPYSIEISLTSKSKDNHLTVDDNWYTLLANREAILAYRIGVNLNSYKLTVYNSNGEIIYSTRTYLYPQDLSQNLSVKKTLLNSLETKQIVLSQLQLTGFKLDQLDVHPEDALGTSGQVLQVEISASDINSANQSINQFTDSFFSLINNINSEKGTYIVLCHLRLVDNQGSLLLDYVKDLEGGTTQWKIADGLENNWSSHPKGPINHSTQVSPGASPTQSSRLFSYPPPTTSTPLPSPTPHPYP